MPVPQSLFFLVLNGIKTVLSSEANFVGHAKVRIKCWKDAQSSKNRKMLLYKAL
jgi:hypothetical protein